MQKTIKLFLVASSFCFANLFATTTKAQSIEEGNIIIDGYYGFPNLWGTVLETSFNSLGVTNTKTQNFGPIGGRLEYLLSDKIGIGVDVHTASTTIKFNDNSSGTLYSYQATATRFRVCPRINIHFNSNDKLDMYGAFGIGYKNTNIKSSSTPDDPSWNTNSLSISITPVTWRAAFGLRYFFSENIGAGLEMGLGGVLATAGLTVRF